MDQIEVYTTYLQDAVKVIDSVFGQEYAKAHPELVSALVQAMIMDTNAEKITDILQTGLKNLSTAIEKGGLVEGR